MSGFLYNYNRAAGGYATVILPWEDDNDAGKLVRRNDNRINPSNLSESDYQTKYNGEERNYDAYSVFNNSIYDAKVRYEVKSETLWDQDDRYEKSVVTANFNDMKFKTSNGVEVINTDNAVTNGVNKGLKHMTWKLGFARN